MLKLRHAGDLSFTDEKDFERIGMSRPEQKRLHREYLKYFPQSSSVFGKLKKVFGNKNDKIPEYINTKSTNTPCDENQHVIPASNIQLCKELGTGEFGSVWLSSWTQPNGEIIQVIFFKRNYHICQPLIIEDLKSYCFHHKI